MLNNTFFYKCCSLSVFFLQWDKNMWKYLDAYHFLVVKAILLGSWIDWFWSWLHKLKNKHIQIDQYEHFTEACLDAEGNALRTDGAWLLSNQFLMQYLRHQKFSSSMQVYVLFLINCTAHFCFLIIDCVKNGEDCFPFWNAYHQLFVRCIYVYALHSFPPPPVEKWKDLFIVLEAYT